MRWLDSIFFLEVAATGFYALLFFVDLIKKQLPTRRTVLFQLLLCALMLNAVFGVDVILSGRFGETLLLDEAVQVLSLLFQATCCVLLHLYMLSTVYKLFLESFLWQLWEDSF